MRFAAGRHPECDILVISIFGDEANVLAALEAGARGYLLKGSLQHDIAFDIQDIRNGGSPLSPVIARRVLKRLQTPGRGMATRTGAEEETTLTARESEILNAISRGFSYAETAQMLGISVGTVHTFLKRIYRKLAVHSKTRRCSGNRLGSSDEFPRAPRSPRARRPRARADPRVHVLEGQNSAQRLGDAPERAPWQPVSLPDKWYRSRRALRRRPVLAPFDLTPEQARMVRSSAAKQSAAMILSTATGITTWDTATRAPPWAPPLIKPPWLC
jgi:DNA-binding CsgD family transcriptional regulator